MSFPAIYSYVRYCYLDFFIAKAKPRSHTAATTTTTPPTPTPTTTAATTTAAAAREESWETKPNKGRHSTMISATHPKKPLETNRTKQNRAESCQPSIQKSHGRRRGNKGRQIPNDLSSASKKATGDKGGYREINRIHFSPASRSDGRQRRTKDDKAN